MTDDIEDRLEELESLVDQQSTNETRRERIADLAERDDPNDSWRADDAGPAVVNRRGAPKAGGLLALLVSGAGTASADPQDQIGTGSDPLTPVHTEELNGGVTGDTALTDLLGNDTKQEWTG